MASCRTLSTAPPTSPTITIPGFFRYCADIFWICAGMVAVNIIVVRLGSPLPEKYGFCAPSGSWSRILLRSRSNPMSIILSASSITRKKHCSNPTSCCSKQSTRRPGVAMTTSTPRSSFSACSSYEWPPISETTSNPSDLNLRNSFSICNASSRVGTMIKTYGPWNLSSLGS
ncbi:hypothetical protein OGAPHI_006008 [Ogataea philodendri]|uniref:Uncharacterized protein n=1 Tax=Ogataea philodendri TaxID=1378263 RepID=A0A9P8NXZ1_9ASCO|nr:uncharacterized protein OGAPHI_006008 [Ogataea philodendri]KAH3661830.1 hypothetical protein OGAPHI_006008 [Ogataea philodendri]